MAASSVQSVNLIQVVFLNLPILVLFLAAAVVGCLFFCWWWGLCIGLVGIIS